MAVWCGQCQTRNETGAERCVKCSAPLRPLAAPDQSAEVAAPSQGVEVATTVQRAASAPAPILNGVVPRPYDPRWLRQLVAEQHPDQVMLQQMVDRCRVAVRTSRDDKGQRIYFLRERAEGQPATPGDRFVCRAPGRSIVIALAADPDRPARRAVYYVETAAAEERGAAQPALIAEHDQLWRDRRALRRELLVAPVVVLALVSVLGLAGGALAGGGSPSGSLSGSLAAVQLALFAAGMTAAFVWLHCRLLYDMLVERQAGIREVSMALGIPGPIVSVDRHFGPLTALAGALTAGAALGLLWLAIRPSLLAGTAVPAWESLAVVLISFGAHPLLLLLGEARRRLAQRDIWREFTSAEREGRGPRFEPWVEFPTA